MIFNHIVLENYSVFEGKCELDLTMGSRKTNVIIIGGKNGTGKTSILEAIRLCLYGSQGVSKRMGREYRAFLKSRINRNALKKFPNAKASLEVVFTEELSGENVEFRVQRQWSAENGDDSLALSRNGKRIQLEVEYWEDFLKILIPPGVAQFFIFDGEKIQDIAVEDQSNSTIVEGIKSLLGLDVFESLQSDLESYARNKLQSEAARATQVDYKQADAELEAAKQNLEQTTLKIEDVSGDLTQQEEKKAELEKSISHRTDKSSREKPLILKEKVSVEEQLKAVEQNIHTFCGNLLPFALVGDLATKLKFSLEKERLTINWTAAKEATYPQSQKLSDLLFGDQSDPPTPPLTDDQRSFFRTRIVQLWESLFVPPPVETVDTLIHELPTSVEAEVVRVIESSRGQISIELEDLQRRQERLANRMRDLDSELNNIPDDPGQGVIFQDLANIHQTIGRLKERRSELGEDEERFTNAVKEAEKRLAKIGEEMVIAEGARAQLDLSKKIRGAIVEYLKVATKSRVSDLTDNVRDMMDRLIRKGDLVADLKIDPKDYEVSLTDRHGIQLKKNELSAGEKEIYAICLLWGLAKTSGRVLPIVIDTPLSRLDSDHRKSIVEKYYPAAGSQVIILSTDTEVDKDYYEMLQPHVERAFLLDYDSGEGRTKIIKGYFW